MHKLTRTLTLAATAALMSVAPALAQDFTMRISTPTVNSPTEKWIEDFKAAVEERSEGRISVEAYPGSQLGPIPATIDGVALGTIEVTAPASGFLAALEPRFLVFDTPGLFDTFEQAQKVMTDPEVIEYVSEFGADKGVEVLTLLPHSETYVLSHDAINGVADFQGQRIRVPGGGAIYTEPLQAMGASPISMPLNEVTSAMQTRTIDGFVAGSPIFIGFKLYDIAQDLTAVPGGLIFAGIVANANFMDSLGDELATMVREEAKKATANLTEYVRDNNVQMVDVWQQNGGNIIEMSAEEQENYRQATTEFLPGYLEANPQFKADYDMLKSAAERVSQ